MKKVSFLLIVCLVTFIFLFLNQNVFATTSDVTWTTKADFESNNSTTGMPSLLSDVKVTGVDQSADVTLSDPFIRIVNSLNPSPRGIGIGINSNNGKIYVTQDGYTASWCYDSYQSWPYSIGSGMDWYVGINKVTNEVYLTKRGESRVEGLGATPGRPYAIDVNNELNKVYVTLPDTNELVVVDNSTKQIIKTLTTGTNPNSVAVCNNKVYVANSNSGSISVINSDDDTLNKNLDIGGSPFDVVSDPLRNKVYVTNSSLNSIQIIDSVTDTLTASINGISSPDYIAVNSANNKVYVHGLFGNKVSVLSGSDYSEIGNISIDVRDLAIDTRNGWLYLVNKWTGVYIAYDAYPDQGTISNLKAENTDLNSSWKSVSWTADTPSDSNIRLKVRGASTEEGLSAANWSTILATGTNLSKAIQQSKWVQIQLTLNSSSDGLSTPVLHDLTLIKETNTGSNSCISCHGPAGSSIKKVDFGVSSVNRTNCYKCHYAGSEGTHVGLYATQGYFDNMINLSTDDAPLYGYFAELNSTDASVQRIHSVHTRSAPFAWNPVNPAMGSANACWGCHETVDCSACHTENIAHKDHTLNTSTGEYAYPPVDIQTTNGIPYISNTQWYGGPPNYVYQSDYLKNASLTCANENCHKQLGASFVAKPDCTQTCHRDHGAVSHTFNEFDVKCQQEGCHPSNNLPEIHQEYASQNNKDVCDICHDAQDISEGKTANCFDCHSSAGPAKPFNKENHPFDSQTLTPVDKETVCVKCHYAGSEGTHIGLYATQGYFDNHVEPYGYFAESNSPYSQAAYIHSKHGTSWAAEANPYEPVPGSVNACFGCHYEAACKACHGPEIEQVAHKEHTRLDDGTYAYPPVSVTDTQGISYIPSTQWYHGPYNWVSRADYLRTQDLTCANPSCHNRLGSEFVAKPSCDNCHNPIIPKAGVVSGTVVDESGVPIEGAVVTTNTGVSTATDIQGIYLLNLTPASYRITFSKPTYDDAIREITVYANRSNDLNVTMRLTRGSISGRITDVNGNRPETSPWLTIDGFSRYWEPDSSGYYVIGDLIPGVYTIRGNATYYESVSQTVLVSANQTINADFLLVKQNGVVNGKAVDSNGNVLSGVSITSDTGVSTATDNNGNYSMSLSWGTHNLTATKNGYNSAVQNINVLANQTSTADFSLTIVTGTVSGRVVDQDGIPLNEAVVTNGTVSVACNSEGNYSMTLNPGTHTLTASKTGYNDASNNVSVVTNENVVCDLSLNIKTGTVSGKVTDNETGAVLAGASVTTNKGLTAATDEQGNYSLVLPPGDYTLTISKTGYNSVEKIISVVAEQTHMVDAALNIKKGTVTGKVTDNSSNPLVGADVVSSNGMSTTTDTQGNYSLALTPGVYSITSSMTGYNGSTSQVTVVAEQIQTINFSLTLKTGTVIGTVNDNYGNTLSGATISSNNGVNTTSNSSGAYTIMLEPGDHTITASKGGYDTSNRLVTVIGDQAVTVDFTLNIKTGTVTGKVTNTDNNPIEGATITSDTGITATSDASGNYSLILVPGVHTITLTKTGYNGLSSSVTVVSEETSNLNFCLSSNNINLALNKYVTASNWRNGYDPAKAVDGSYYSRWWCSSSVMEWIKVYLGSVYSVSKVKLTWPSGYEALSYKVEISEDGYNWTKVYTTSYGSSGTKTITFGAKNACYVKVTCTKTRTTKGYSLSEFEIYQN